jgi:hypothetical protein
MLPELLANNKPAFVLDGMGILLMCRTDAVGRGRTCTCALCWLSPTCSYIPPPARCSRASRKQYYTTW